jgi:hypothetical protein
LSIEPDPRQGKRFSRRFTESLTTDLSRIRGAVVIMDSCKQRHDCEGWRGCQRYPVGRAKRGVRLLASILIHMKPKPIQ